MKLLEKRSERLRAGLSSTLAQLRDEPSPKRVHRLRTTIRRIESLVAFAEPQLGRKQERAIKDLAALRRRAGRVRDLDVQLELLGAIGNTSTALDRKLLGDVLKRKRGKQIERLSAAVVKTREQRFRTLFDTVAAEASAAPLLLDESAEPLERAKRELAEIGEEYSSQAKSKTAALHETRIRLKRIRYLAELGEDSAEQKSFLAAMKSVQDALGAWHDWEELTKTAEKEFGSRANCPLLVEVRALFAAQRSASVAAVSHLFSAYRIESMRKPAHFAFPERTLAQRA
ncbi:MAG TPA: CHAD domain-containing protein [Candidatus Angelobacter sp.]|nr:CHAD domain-containing protein [Candidatus Angelobacter sp.]